MNARTHLHILPARVLQRTQEKRTALVNVLKHLCVRARICMCIVMCMRSVGRNQCMCACKRDRCWLCQFAFERGCAPEDAGTMSKLHEAFRTIPSVNGGSGELASAMLGEIIRVRFLFDFEHRHVLRWIFVPPNADDDVAYNAIL